MEKPKCPGCKKEIDILDGVWIDNHHNVFCMLCDEVVMAATFQEERKSKTTTTTSTTTYPHHGHHHYHQANKNKIGFTAGDKDDEFSNFYG